MTSEISVIHDRDRHRWEARIGEELAGFATYRPSEGVIDVQPSCPVVAAWMERHPDYQHLTTRERG